MLITGGVYVHHVIRPLSIVGASHRAGEAADSYQYTAFHLAAQRSNAEIIDVLVEAGANVEARTSSARTPLHGAAACLSLEAIAVLVKYSAHVNADDDDSATPLHLAAFRVGTQRVAEVMDRLLRSGADEDVMNNEDWTAMEVVYREDRHRFLLPDDEERVLQLLASASADRAWRRRGYLVLCRAHPDRVEHAGTGSGFSERVDEAAVHEGIGADPVSVEMQVLALSEEGLFRTIVGYL